MSTTQYAEILSKNTNLNQITIYNWFLDKGFEFVQFEGSNMETFTSFIYHSIKKNETFDTYYKEDIGGSLLVFEVKISNSKFECICYSPISLFGFFNLKISFKNKSSWLTKYRAHGYEYLIELKEFIITKNLTTLF